MYNVYLLMDVTHYHACSAQLGLSGKGPLIIELVVLRVFI